MPSILDATSKAEGAIFQPFAEVTAYSPPKFTPEFIGAIDAIISVGDDSEKIECARVDHFEWSLDHSCHPVKWRPSLNQSSIAGPDTKESAIHKAWVALGGKLSNCENGHPDQSQSALLIKNSDFYYATLNKSLSKAASNDGWELVCTIQEFTDYCEKMAAEEKRIDITGKPIFTQAMADAGELPPVGAKAKVCIEKAGFDIDNSDLKFEGKVVIIRAAFANEEGEKIVAIENEDGNCACFIIECIEPLYTRTDREKMHEQIHNIMTDDSGRFMKFSELPDYTIESYDKLIDTFGLLKC